MADDVVGLRTARHLRSRTVSPIAPRRPRSLDWLCLVAVTAALAAAGCGGCGGQSKGPDAKWGGMSEAEWRKKNEARQAAERAKEEAARKVQAKRTADENRKRQEARRQADARKREEAAKRKFEAAQQAAAKPKPKPKPKRPPPLPEAFADWKESDYRAARTSGDPRLPAAVRYLGEKTVGRVSTATLLAELLQPRLAAGLRDRLRAEVDGEDEEGSPQAGPGSGALVEAIADALGANGTPMARQTLGRLITGRLETEHDRAGALAAIKSLVDHPSPEHEDMLFQVVTAAAKVRPPGQGNVSPEQLQSTAVALLNPAASSGFRVRIAEFIVETDTPQTLRELLGQLIGQMNRQSLEAQRILYQSSAIGDSTKTAIEGYFVEYASDTLGWVLGVREKRDALASSPNWPSHVARAFWSPTFGELLDRRLEEVRSLEEGAAVLAMAGTVPSDAMRSALFRTLDRHWEDGPGALRRVGMAEKVVSEPGFLPLLKVLQRRKAGALRAEAGKYPAYGKSSRMTDLVSARQKRGGEIEQDWATFVRDVLLCSCRQLGAASPGRDPAAEPLSAAGLPFALHPAARVRAVCRLDWPADLREKLGDARCDPCRALYVRIEENNRPTKILAYYRRQLKSLQLRELAHGVWLDSLDPGSDPSRKRSLDVLITAANPSSSRLPDEEQKIVVEIVMVEIRDPAESSRRNPVSAGSTEINGVLTEN